MVRAAQESEPESRLLRMGDRRGVRMMTQNGRDVADLVHRAMVTTWPSYGDEDLKFLTLGMVGEAGEVANVVKKFWRGDSTYTKSADAAEKFYADLSDEIA